MIKSALTGCIVVCATLVFGQDSSNFTALNSNVQDQEPVIVEAPEEIPTNLALGNNAEATGNYAIAIGNGAHADMDNTMVLGGVTENDRVSVGIGTSNPNSLSSLDLADFDKGLLVNRLTNQQAEMFEMALGIADEGMMIYNTTEHILQTWDGLKWKNVETKHFELKDHQLTINEGPTVDLSPYQQDLKAATLNGRQLTIEIENGDEVIVDLSPLFREYDDRLAAIESSLADATALNSEASIERAGDLSVSEKIRNQTVLEQNAPNPFTTSTLVKFVLPEGGTSVGLQILNSEGKVVRNEVLDPTPGPGEKLIHSEGLAPGRYYLSLFIDREKVKTVTMLIR